MLEVEDGDLEIRRRTLDTPTGEAPRDFLQVPVQFGEQDGIGLVEQRLDEALGPQETLDEQLVVVELHGDDTTVSQRDVYDLVDSRGAGVVHVQDKRRASVDLDFEGGETDVADIQSLIDDTISELGSVVKFNEEMLEDESVGNEIRNNSVWDNDQHRIRLLCGSDRKPILFTEAMAPVAGKILARCMTSAHNCNSKPFE